MSRAASRKLTADSVLQRIDKEVEEAIAALEAEKDAALASLDTQACPAFHVWQELLQQAIEG